MATVKITTQNLQQTIDSNPMVLIDFWADWCGPCKMFGPVFEKVSEKYPDLVFGKCDTEDQPEVAAAFGIQSIPTLAIFKEGELIFLQPGALPANMLDQLIEKVRSLDMQKVRQGVEKKQKSPEGKPAPAQKPKPGGKQPAPRPADPGPVVATVPSGEGLALMADDFQLRRQGVTRAFLERAGSIDCARAALELYRRARDAGEQGPDALAGLREEYEKLVPGLQGELAKLDPDTRGEIKGVLRAIEQLLRS